MLSNHLKQLFLTSVQEESVVCAHCGYCNSVCCTYRLMDWESTSPRGWLALVREALAHPHQMADIYAFLSPRLFNCTLCGKCGQACPVHIDLRSLWLELREQLVGRGLGPDFAARLQEAVRAEKNIFAFPNQERAAWVKSMARPTAHLYHHERAEVVYYVGCLSAFSPAVQSIPQALAQVLERAQVDFALLGGEEWCCGYPLIAAGLKAEAKVLIAHNLEAVQKMGARTVIFGCPSCYHTWGHYYPLDGIQLYHSTQFLAHLLEQRRLRLGRLRARVAYHDPCDLGRNFGVYAEPRQVLQRIPGLELVELLHHGPEGLCCGGGGDFEMLEPAMTQGIAQQWIGEVQRAQVDALVVACQQCKRVALDAREALGVPLDIIDIAELVYLSGLVGDRGAT